MIFIRAKMSQNNNTEENIFFHGLLENRTSKVLAILFSVLLSVLVSVSASGVIWYERFGSDLQRIFTNKMVSSVCWSILGFYGFTQLPELVFYLFNLGKRTKSFKAKTGLHRCTCPDRSAYLRKKKL